MGGAESKVEQVNKNITNISTQTMINNTVGCNLSVIQDQTINMSGNAKMKGSTIEQTAKINVQCLMKSDINLKLQNELKSKLKNFLKNDVTAQTFGYSKSASKIENIVETNVEDSFSVNNLSEMNSSIAQKQLVTMKGNALMEDSKIIQYAKVVGKLTNDFTNKISRELRQDTDVSNKALAKTTSALDSTFTGVNNILGTMFTWSTGSIIMGIGCSCCCCLIVLGSAFMSMGSSSNKNTTVTEQVGEGFKQLGKGIGQRIGGYLPKSTMGRIFLIIGVILFFVMAFFGYAYYVGNSIREEKRQKYISEYGIDPNIEGLSALHYKDRLSKRSIVQLPDDELEQIEYRNRARKMGALDNPIPPAAPITPMTAGYLPGTNKTVTY